ncbi:MAG: hypothetical protein ABL949_03300 [Fimbriimonadaceae bacterium]
MAKTVVILGAGASAAAGAPLMFDFLDAAERIQRNKMTGVFGDDFDRVFKGLYELERVLSKAVVDINNLEAVFGAFEMAKLCGKLGELAKADIDLLTESLKKVILRTVELTVQHRGQRVGLRPPDGYLELSDLLQKKLRHDIVFLTFNYDLGLDHALYEVAHEDPYYGFGERSDSSVTLLKLHGSIHWYKQEQNGLRAIPMRDLLAHPWVETSHQNASNSNVIVSQKLENLGNRVPFIVPPTWKKGDHYSEIAEVWKLAATHLEHAENIYVCGFSLPHTDQYFRYLYALGTAGQTRIKRFVVSDPSSEVALRFRQLLGPTALVRFEQSNNKFAEFVIWLRKNFPD